MARIRLGVWIYPYGAGGVEHFLCRLFPVLRKRGFDIVCFSSSPGLGCRFFARKGFRPLIVGKNAQQSREALAQLILKCSIDMMMTTCVELSGAAASRLAGVPHVWRSGGMVDLDQKLSPAARKELLRLIDLLSEKVIVNSRMASDQFSNMKSSKIVRIPNGLPHRRPLTSGKAPDLRRRFSWRPSDPIVAMSAHFYPIKQHEDFIEAAAIVRHRLPDCRFVVLGETFSGSAARVMGGYAAFLSRLRKTRRLGGHLHFLKGADDLENILPQINLIVHPCPVESFPNAVLEAMAAGRPIVAADGGGCAELLDHGKTAVLVPPGRPDRIAFAVEELLVDPGKASRLGKAAQRLARKRYGIFPVARSYEKVFRDVLF